MNEFETVTHLMIVNHISYDDLAEQMGKCNSGNLYNTLNKNKNIYVSSMRKILDAMGYEMVFRRKDGKGSEYVVNDDNTPSSLRFHDMNLNLESIFGEKPKEPTKAPSLTVGERTVRSEKLKKRIGQLSIYECDKELRRIWSIEEPVEGRRTPPNEYMGEYERYRKEFSRLYEGELYPPSATVAEMKKRSLKKKKSAPATRKKDVSPVTSPAIPIPSGAHGKELTAETLEDKGKVMTDKQAIEKAMRANKSKSDMLAGLVAGLQMED